MQSAAEILAAQPDAEVARLLEPLGEAGAAQLLYDWRFWARPAQLPPEGDWSTWVILAGRGFGKTRSGAEFVRGEVESGRCKRMALVAPTASDVRDVMVEGESGIMAICPPNNRPLYEPSKRRLTWPNGALATLYTADEPERLRGPQHDGFWADELASWRYPEAWDQLMFGMRLGSRPRGIVTTTPKPIRLLKDVLALPGTVVSGGSTYDNRANLAPTFFTSIIARYEGTRLGRQELLAEILEDVEGALWSRTMIDESRVAGHPDLVHVVVGVDPAVTAGEDSDETGIVVAGKGVDGEFYILADRSGRLSPDGWGKRVVNSYTEFEADRVIGEVNNGGDLVESNVRNSAKDLKVRVTYKAVRASRGKAVRAEPIVGLYEQGHVHHVGSFPALEDQMCLVAGSLISTNFGEIPIESIERGTLVLTRKGWRRVLWAGQTGVAAVVEIRGKHGQVIKGTANHPIYVKYRGFIPFGTVQKGDILLSCHTHPKTLISNSTANASFATVGMVTSRQVELAGVSYCTERFGSENVVLFRVAGMSTTSTTTEGTTTSQTSRPSRLAGTSSGTRLLGSPSKDLRSGADEPGHGGLPGSLGLSSARFVDVTYSHEGHSADFAEVIVASVTDWPSERPVFNLTVEDVPEYFADGFLVHNCSFVPGVGDDSPDHMDALVWAMTELAPDRVHFKARVI